MNVLRGIRHYSNNITRSASHAAHPHQVQQQGVKVGSGRNDGWGRADPSHHANSKLWRNLSLFVAGPAVIVMSIYTYMVEKEHMAHPEHSRPPFVAYEYLHRRTKVVST
ncbi:hypothetical protein RvY_10059-2 [Ramazzottius varieornatus]|uniref:Uncharacterized protein n=1 Tax=Ramazzottius varieornatus TaxID=947166 RepID=A0A1D1VGV5_RAMVA|nr:hypothetical protein RvY_10059-2 [Ramazzottius varieornatus]